MNFDLAETGPCGLLWLAVLIQAAEDATVLVPKPVTHKHNPKCRPNCRRLLFTEEHYHQRTAMLWFHDDRKFAGSFEWLCSQVGLEPTDVRDELRSKRAKLYRQRRQHLVKGY